MVEKEMMSWDSCLKEHVKKINKDVDKAKAVLKMAELRHEFWSHQDFSQKYASLVVDGYYEVIKELLTALFYLNGYKSDNHECLIAYLKQFHPELSYEVSVVYQLKKVRNDIDYRGFFVSHDYLERNRMEFNHIIKSLSKIVRDKLED